MLGVNVIVGVGVIVGEGVLVGVGVLVDVGVAVGVGVAVAVGVAVGAAKADVSPEQAPRESAPAKATMARFTFGLWVRLDKSALLVKPLLHLQDRTDDIGGRASELVALTYHPREPVEAQGRNRKEPLQA